MHVVRQRDVHSFNPPALKLAKARRLFADSSPEADSSKGMSSKLGPSLSLAALSAGCAVNSVAANARDQHKCTRCSARAQARHMCVLSARH